MKRIIFILVVVMTMASCAPDPRKEAEAYQTRLEADANKNLSDENLSHLQDIHAIDLQNKQREQDAKDAAIAEQRVATKRFIAWVSFVGTLAVCVIALFFTYNTAMGMKGIREATVRAAEVRANLIYIDKDTGMFPLLTIPLGQGRYMIHDPNDGSTLHLDMHNSADRQKIAIGGQVRVTGLLARNAKESNDPAGMSLIDPSIVSAKDAVITVGSEET